MIQNFISSLPNQILIPLVSSTLNSGYVALLHIFRFSTLEMDDPTVYFASRPYNSLSFPLALTLSALQFFYAYSHRITYVRGPIVPNVISPHNRLDLSGKVYIITGGNTGIGYETAKYLLLCNSTVILACRSSERANEAKKKLIKETNVDELKIIFIPLDLCSYKSVRAFVEKFNSLNLRLDCLINNAGMMLNDRIETEDKQETLMQANHLSHFLLTNLLLPNLEKTEGRVVNLSSCVHNNAKKFNFDDIMSEKYFEMFSTYGQTKLANILFTSELQRRMDEKGSKVLSVAVHPGCVRTSVTRNMNWFMQLGNKICSPILALLQKNPEEGAYTSLYLATAPRESLVGGGYYFHSRLGKVSPAGLDKEDAKKLWEVSEKLTGYKSN